MRIRSIAARPIYDSRGAATVEAKVILENGAVGVGSAPSGASTGSHEAKELRDADRGVSRAVRSIEEIVAPALVGKDARRQSAIDRILIELDGTPDKSKLGGNVCVAVSWAVADAAARGEGAEMYAHIGGLNAVGMPCPMFNLLNGGRHADNNLEIQEFMLAPAGADTFSDAMRMGTDCRRALKELLAEDGLSTGVGDEGGFAPNLADDESALEYLMRAIEKAGYRAGEDVFCALDAAANEWARGSMYVQPKSERRFEREELMENYVRLADKYPLISIEDPFGEEDFEGFREITERLGGNVMIVGDDLFTTNPDRLLTGAAMNAANAILIKPNQIGTLTETLETIRLARQSGYDVIVSHRSGETLSTAIADLAVAVNAEFIKAGAPARGERLAKYNRLLEIEAAQ